MRLSMKKNESSTISNLHNTCSLLTLVALKGFPMSINHPNSSLYRTSDGYHQVLRFYDESLAKLGIPFHSRFVDTSFGQTHTIMCGEETGEQIVLWHGLNANLTSWIQWILTLSSTYSIHAIDTIGGMGKSSPARPRTKGNQYGEWAVEVLHGLDLECVNHVGISNGGWLILKLANVTPKLIGTAVIMSSASFGPVNLLFILKLIPRIMFKSASEAADQLNSLLSPPGLPPDPFFLEFFRLTMASGFRSKPTPPALSDDEIRKLVSPSCFLVGQHEITFDPYKALKRALQLLHNLVSAEVVPGVGHGMVHQDPTWVTNRVIRFLNEYAV
jgi:pimeloyl-ACP methyl ester carboxylesterase